MSNKFKCPACQNNLHKINMVVSTCTNDKCKLWGSSIPNLVLEALTQAKQDLEVARKALKKIESTEWYDSMSSYEIMTFTAMKALETIGKHKVDDNE